MTSHPTAPAAGVRRAGSLLESVHAVVYFAPEPAAAYAALGLRGFWRGYFAGRTAALGPVDAEQAVPLLGGFAPAMVARALPEVWTLASPDQVLPARTSAATEALHRLTGGPDVSELLDLLAPVVARLDCRDRPMAAAHRAAFAAQPAEDALCRLWQLATVLREHRGDAHLQAVAEAGLRWPEPHLLLAETGRLDPRQQEHRGWDDAAWRMARERVTTWRMGRTAQDSYEQLERRTDELVSGSFEERKVGRLCQLLEPVSSAVLAAGGLPFPNAMGLADPRPAGRVAAGTRAGGGAGGRPCSG